MTILRVFEQAHGDKALAGKMLGISRATLYRKLKRYNIAPRGTAEHSEKEPETHEWCERASQELAREARKSQSELRRGGWE